MAFLAFRGVGFLFILIICDSQCSLFFVIMSIGWYLLAYRGVGFVFILIICDTQFSLYSVIISIGWHL